MSDFQLLLPDEETDYYDNYFTKTEALFSALRGRTLLLSPADYQLAKKWYEQGIPLSCVLRGIRAAFFYKMEKDEDYEDILSLSFCKWAVTKEWKEYKKVTVEPEEEAPFNIDEKSGDETDAILDSLLFDLHKSIFKLKEDGQEDLSLELHQAHAAIAEEKANWSKEPDFQKLEKSLAEIDERMLELVLIGAPVQAKKATQAVNRKLKGMDVNLDAKTLKKTKEQAVKAKLRELLKLPRITLYSTGF